MKLFGIKACDTCRKAQKSLSNKGFEVTFVDIRDSPLSREQLAGFHAAFGDALLNRRSTTWRGLSDAERAGDSLDLLLAHPTLMKRPVLEDGDRRTLGWDAAAQAVWLA